MKKLLILSAGFLCVTGFVSIVWAHGPNGGSSGYRGYSYSKPHFNKSFQPRSGRHFGQHHRHLHHGSLTHSKQRHLRRAQRSHRLPGIVNGVIQSKPGPLQNRSFSSPIQRLMIEGLASARSGKRWRSKPRPILYRPALTIATIRSPGFFMARAKTSGRWV